jgi:hypothetical protein
MTHDKLPLGVFKPGAYTGLDLSVDVQKIKIFFNTMSAVLNLVMLNVNKLSR